jgi:lipoyl-dependent peroxiredoxin
MNITPVYEAQATATGGRDGRATTSDNKIDVKLSPPKEMGGTGEGTNPEQLFASGYSACFLGAMKFATTQDKSLPKVPNDASVTATVGIGPRPDKGFGLAVTLSVSLPGVERSEAERLVQAGDEICPYSHATRGNIEVKLQVA